MRKRKVQRRKKGGKAARRSLPALSSGNLRQRVESASAAAQIRRILRVPFFPSRKNSNRIPCGLQAGASSRKAVLKAWGFPGKSRGGVLASGSGRCDCSNR